MSRVNLLTNPSFEVDALGWNGAGGTVPTRLSGGASAKAGTWSAYVGPGQIAKSSRYAATAGLAYTGSVWSTKITAAARACAVSLHFFDTAGAELSAPTVTGADIVTPNAPERRSITRTAPAGTTHVEFWWHNTSLSGASTTVFDAALLEESATLGDYFDGSTAMSGFTYAWTGSAHASASTETADGGDPITVAFKRYESGSFVSRTAVPRAWDGTAWVVRRPKRWSGSAWVDLP